MSQDRDRNGSAPPFATTTGAAGVRDRARRSIAWLTSNATTCRAARLQGSGSDTRTRPGVEDAQSAQRFERIEDRIGIARPCLVVLIYDMIKHALRMPDRALTCERRSGNRYGFAIASALLAVGPRSANDTPFGVGRERVRGCTFWTGWFASRAALEFPLRCPRSRCQVARRVCSACQDSPMTSKRSAASRRRSLFLVVRPMARSANDSR